MSDKEMNKCAYWGLEMLILTIKPHELLKSAQPASTSNTQREPPTHLQGPRSELKGYKMETRTPALGML